MISRGNTLLNLQIPKFKKKARKGFWPLSAMYGIGYFQNFGNFLGIFFWEGAHCFHMEVKVAVLNEISQNYNFFEVKLVPYASLCLGNYLDHFFL